MDVSRLNMDDVMQTAEEMDGGGYCVACGEYHDGIEPDARRCKCDACGALAVYGAEEIILQGAF